MFKSWKLIGHKVHWPWSPKVRALVLWYPILSMRYMAISLEKPVQEDPSKLANFLHTEKTEKVIGFVTNLCKNSRLPQNVVRWNPLELTDGNGSVFDQSSCHTAMVEDALDVSRMNVGQGGKQPPMCDTIWAGKTQEMCFNIGVPKGMKIILEKRGRKKRHGNESQKPWTFLQWKATYYLLSWEQRTLPKFHPELNPIERVWAQSKTYTKAHYKYTFPF